MRTLHIPQLPAREILLGSIETQQVKSSGSDKTTLQPHGVPPMLIWIAMSSHQVVATKVRAIFPTNAGCAVFLGNDDKVFVIYVDPAVGSAIAMTMKKVSRERPQTHDLIGRIFQGLVAKVDRIVVNDFNDGVFYGRLIIHMDNEIGEKKIVEIDARPSDCLAIALQESCPIYVAQHLWNRMEDMTEILYKMEDQDLGFTKDED